MMDHRARVAGAPITWGVSEVAGWGHQLPAERVLREAAAAGLQAMEAGPPGFLPVDPAQAGRILTVHGLRLAGGFLGVVLHRPEQRERTLAAVAAAARALSAAGARLLALAAAPAVQAEARPGREAPSGSAVATRPPAGPAEHAGLAGSAVPAAYERSPELSPAEWSALLTGLARARQVARESGVTIALHPHYGTVIERPHHLARVLETSDVPLCLDTGHLLIGGADPLEIVHEAAPRIVHVHLKDVDADLAGRVRRGELGYRAAVSQGLYRPLGAGDVDVRGVVQHLEALSYGGWYVLEQDTVLTGEPAEGSGPGMTAKRSLEFLHQVMSG